MYLPFHCSLPFLHFRMFGSGCPFVSLLFFIEAWLTYNVVPVSGMQQSDSVIYIYIFFLIVFSIIGYYKILNIVPYAIQ